MSDQPTNRAAVINDTIREILALEEQRKSISEDIREIKQTRIKGELGMKIADFNAAMRLWRLEDDDRTQYLATIRETFEALGIGEQLDWLKVQEQQDRQAAAGAEDTATDAAGGEPVGEAA